VHHIPFNDEIEARPRATQIGDYQRDQIIFAKNRADLEAATRALDRILLWNHYVVPQWYYNKVRTARWDRFGHPDLMPKYGTTAFPTVWWWDVQKAAKAG
jgi:microcin C transport system substrate-binding protein